MNNPVTVEVLERCNELDDIALDLQLVKSLPPPKQFIESLIPAYL
jgi:hypothetical protein